MALIMEDLLRRRKTNRIKFARMARDVFVLGMVMTLTIWHSVSLYIEIQDTHSHVETTLILFRFVIALSPATRPKRDKSVEKKEEREGGGEN